MNSWSEDYYSRLEKIRNQIPKTDFRFFNLGHLPLIAKKTEGFSAQCHTCKSNLKTLAELAEMLPDCLLQPESRKVFEKNKYQVEKHLYKIHRVSYANFYYSLFSFLGVFIGIIIGSILSYFITKKINVNYMLISGTIGLLAGQIFGKKRDHIKYKKKYQI